eukprot:scaffold38791_cov258-Isochrysis_galbana.AAC.3
MGTIGTSSCGGGGSRVSRPSWSARRTSSVRLLVPVLSLSRRTYFSMCPLETLSAVAISLLSMPCPTSSSTSRSRLVSRGTFLVIAGTSRFVVWATSALLAAAALSAAAAIPAAVRPGLTARAKTSLLRSASWRGDGKAEGAPEPRPAHSSWPRWVWSRSSCNSCFVVETSFARLRSSSCSTAARASSALASSVLISASSSSGSNGLLRYAEAPAEYPAMRSLAKPLADSSTTGIAHSRWSARMRRSSARPSIPCISTSVITRSGLAPPTIARKACCASE